MPRIYQIIVVIAFLASHLGVAVAQEQALDVQTLSLSSSTFTIPDGSTMWSPDLTDQVYVIGGLGSDGDALNAIAVLDIGDAATTGTSNDALTLSQARAWATTVESDSSLFVIGGIDNGVTLDSAVELVWTEEGVSERPLPAMPAGLAYSGAAILEEHLYVVGGTSSWPDWSGHEDVWRLSITSPDDGWEHVGNYPGGVIVQPSVEVRFGEIYVFGGWQPVVSTSASDWESTDTAWGYRLTPVDGKTDTGWRALANMPSPMAGQAVLPTGQAHVALVGGVNGAWRSPTPSDAILIYHGITNTWVERGNTPVSVGVANAFTHPPGHVVYPQGTLGTAGAVSTDLYRIDFAPYGNKFGVIDYSVVILYFLFMVAIVWYFADRQDNSEEYALGARSVRWWATGISIFATGTSSISFMAVPAISYAGNLVFLLPFLLVPPLLFILNGWLVYPMLRRLDLTSTYEYLQARFNAPLRIIASFQNVSFQVVGRMSVVMLLPSLAISAVTGIDVVSSVLIMGLLTTIGTTLGGFEAVVWMDVTQGLLMLFGMLLMIFLAIWGLPGNVSEFLSIGQEYSKFDAAILGFDYTLPILVLFLFSTFFQLFGAVGDQPIVQRVFATPKKDMKKLAGIVSVATMVGTTVTIFTGLAIFAYFHAHPEILNPTMRNDQIVPIYIAERLPVGIAGLIIAALFAASMSTLSSSMNSVATLVNKDFALRVKPSMTDRQQLILMKATSALSGLIGTAIAVVMASLSITSMFQTWNKLWALLGGGFIGMYILGIFTSRANSIGVITGAIASVAVTYYVEAETNIHYLFLNPIAIATCVVVGYVVSLLTPSYDSSRLKNLTVWNS